MKTLKAYIAGLVSGVILSVAGFTGIIKLLDHGVDKIKDKTSNILIAQSDQEFLKSSTAAVKKSSKK
jgi:uncharacterized iron-regulated membrane protein